MQSHQHIPARKDAFEELAWQSQQLVVGIDEAGRGCLAGPVVVGAVILPPHATHPLLIDSKKLTAQQREDAYDWIIKNAAFTHTVAAHHVIDQHNIYQTTLSLMHLAWHQLVATYPDQTRKVQALLVDAMPLKISQTATLRPAVHYFNFGETLSSSIAAASIIAKVTRDRLVEQLHQSFPGYALDQHKGYATALHRQLITTQGPSLIHRTTYLEFLDEDSAQQQELF